MLAAVGLDEGGEKHLLGLARGSSENAAVVKDLLNGLVERGVDASMQRLFVIDGSKAMRSAIEQVYGEQALVQRCRVHKVRNVTERLPERERAQTKSVMHAAYKLSEKEGIVKLRQHAKWLQSQYPDAAASLLEGLEESFTVNRLRLTPALIRCLSTTNIIENPNGAVPGNGQNMSMAGCRHGAALDGSGVLGSREVLSPHTRLSRPMGAEHRAW